MRELKTERLLLRYITREDVPAIYEGWANDPEVARYVTWNAHEDISVTENRMDFWLEEYKKPDCCRYGIERLSDGALMGMIDVVGYHHGNPVIGYCSGRKYWGQRLHDRSSESRYRGAVIRRVRNYPHWSGKGEHRQQPRDTESGVRVRRQPRRTNLGDQTGNHDDKFLPSEKAIIAAQIPEYIRDFSLSKK